MWQVILAENAPVVLVVISLLSMIIAAGFGLLAKLAYMIWQQHRENEKTELSRVADKLEDLVDQIKTLFTRQDEHGKKLDEQGKEIGGIKADLVQVRGDLKRQKIYCQGRERFVDEKLGVGNSRQADPPYCDSPERTD